ncbi:MAG: nicotinate (nicotinamide) nucleotide adenylyltransferase [Rhodothermales bacterium]|nr:nicotinate (nicotinamide) nucleotide adenylyltransferase [Rhodothermales bacterium]
MAVFGGSFNPPHLGHLIIAEHVRVHCQIDRVVWIPGYIPPHKKDRELASATHRLAMVELVVADNPAFVVSDMEIARRGVSYTVDTLEALAADEPEAELFLIIGGDSFAAFDAWHKPERIKELATLIVYDRKDNDYQRPIAGEGRVLFVDGPVIEISSTMVRSAIQSGRSVRYLVPNTVKAYMEKNGLYA